MKVLEQARANLPQKPAQSSKPAQPTKPAVKGTSKPQTFTADDDDIEAPAAAAAKPSSAAASKAVSKTGKPNSASAAGKKVQFSFCLLTEQCYLSAV